MDIVEAQRAFDEADRVYRNRMREENEKLLEVEDTELRHEKAAVAIPSDIRNARDEACAQLNAATAELHERWVVAHEDLAVLRRSGLPSKS